jgi:hypothetical protein
LLKNLGSWLGKFTIGRNQALRAKEVDPKVLIVEVILHLPFVSFKISISVILCKDHAVPASCCIQLSNFFNFDISLCFPSFQAYERGLMIAVIPFTSKVLLLILISFFSKKCTCIFHACNCDNVAFRFSNLAIQA